MVKGVPPSMMDCMFHARVKPYIIIREMSTAGMDLQKGGYAGLWRRTVIGLGLILGTAPKEVWTSLQLGYAARIRSLMGKAAHLCRV